MPVQIPADADLNTLRTPGFYWCDGSTNANRPDDSGSFCLLIEKTGSWAGNGVKQTFTNYDSGAIYTRVSPKDIWKPWRLLATATPPQEFDLPLAEGITAHSPCTYCKTQEKIVLMRINFLTTSQLTESNQIAVLPVGFRPEKLVEMLAYINNGTMCTLKILPSGVLSVGNGSIPVGTVCWTTVPLFIGT